jgi:hypothetical protein
MREVTNEEVVTHASKKCKACHGQGWLHKWVHTDANHMERVRLVCKCAEKRFLKEMGDRLVKQPDGVVMLKEEAVAA